MPLLFAFLIPLAITIGWLYKMLISIKSQATHKISTEWQQNYLVGLNYLLSEQPDRAVDAFIKAIEIDSNTIETHLALGALFRKKGEVERAIRIHQNLIARPQLSKQQRIEALLELGKDYFSAGMLDRAEGVFLEVINMAERTEQAFIYLIEIYEQEKSWQQAIQTAQKLQASNKKAMPISIGHYYCELAEDAMQAGEHAVANKYLKQALACDPKSVRASILLGQLEAKLQNYKAAIAAYKTVEQQNPDYLPEIIKPLLVCYQQQHNESGWLNYIQACYKSYPRLSLALALSHYLQQQANFAMAYQVLVQHMKQQPSAAGVAHLLNLQMTQSHEKEPGLLIIQECLNALLMKQTCYRCQNCGYAGKTLLWLCPGCHKWSTIKPLEEGIIH